MRAEEYVHQSQRVVSFGRSLNENFRGGSELLDFFLPFLNKKRLNWK